MIDTQLVSAKTAIHRNKVSAPLQWLLDNDLIKGESCNWGEGRAFLDTEAMDQRTGFAIGYDPNSSVRMNKHMPHSMLFDTVYCGYVLNTLDSRTASNVVEQIRHHLTPRGTAYFAVRVDEVHGEPYLDGVITKRGTFQMSYAPYAHHSNTYDWIYKTGHYAIFKIQRYV
jgi:hypothetical protein